MSTDGADRGRAERAGGGEERAGGGEERAGGGAERVGGGGGTLRRLARRILRPSTLALVAGAALWVWAAQALWSDTVPGSLELPEVDPSRFFTDAFLDRSASYERFLAIVTVLATVTLLVVLWVYAKRGHRLMRESAAGRIGTGMLLGMLGFAVVWLAELPFGLATLWWERRYGVSDQGYLNWAAGDFLHLGWTFLFVAVALVVAMGFAGVLKRWWWVAAAPVFIGLALLSTFLRPFGAVDTMSLDSQRLAEARALERVEGLSDTRFVVEDVHRYTTAPNAEASGFGPTQTVKLWDTLLGGEFSDDEVRVVIAHELAHLAHDDPLKSVGWLALFLVPASALIAYVTRRRGGLARPEAVPLALFVLIALTVATTPLFYKVSRHDEAAADWAALNATLDPTADRTLLRGLARTSLGNPDPPGWSQALFSTHPTIMQRIAMAYAWEERHRGSATANGPPGDADAPQAKAPAQR